MKYYKETYIEEKNDFEKVEITRDEARKCLCGHYRNIEECLDMPSYYRTPFFGIEVVEEKQ